MYVSLKYKNKTYVYDKEGQIFLKMYQLVKINLEEG